MVAQVPVQEWGAAFITSATAALALFLGAIPRILAFAAILIIGWFIASLIAKGVGAALRSMNFNDLAARSGFSNFVRNMGVGTDPSGALALTVKWFVRLIALIVAFDALGLPAVSQVLQQLLLWLPNVIVAIVVLVIAGLAANALASLVRGATAQAGFTNPGLLATITRVAVWGFGIVIAVNQLGIASTLVNTLFTALIGAVALALGLAFGLGGRDTASDIVRNWYAAGRRAAPKIEAASEIAADEATRRDTRRPAA
jgi:mechanosensitive ion channel-like protein